MWDLFFRLRADNSPLQRDMAKSSAFFDTWAEKQSKKMGETFWKGVSLATAGAVALRGFSAATQAAEDTARLAAETHRTVEEMIQLQRVSEDTGKSISDLVAILKGGGQPARTLWAEMRNVRGLHPKIGAVYGLAGENVREWGRFVKPILGFVGAIPTALFNIASELPRTGMDLIAAAKNGSWQQAKGAFSNAGLRLRSPQEWQARQIEKLRRLSAPATGDMPEIDEFFKKFDDEKERRERLNEEMEESRKAAEAKRITGLAYMRPATDADALTRVGIFSARSGAEERQYQRDSLNYLAAIKENTYRFVSLAMPPVDPLDIQ